MDAARLALHGLPAAHVVVAVSASGSSAFAPDAIDEANRRAPFTIAFVNTAEPPLARAASRSMMSIWGTKSRRFGTARRRDSRDGLPRRP